VRAGKKWVDFEDMVKESRDDEVLKEYTKRRDKAANTVAAQMELADWCRRQKLVDQQRAHLTAVLQLEPDHAAARAQLGHVRVDDVWLSKEEVDAGRERALAAAAALRRWTPRMKEIRESIAGSPARKSAALAQLRKINDPAAIPAMEAELSSAGEAAGLALVEGLARIEAADASLALARQAIYSRYDEVRDEAAQRLKDRQLESYVPALLASLRTPWQSRMQVARAPGGRLLYRHAAYSEGEHRAQLAVLDHTFRLEGDMRRALSQAGGEAVASAARRRVSAEVENDTIERHNRRVCDLLQETTGQKLSSDPDDWWRWWNDYNEVYYTDPKPVQQRYARSESAVYVPEELAIPSSTGGAATPRTGGECLAAGTPVWTNTGRKAVERVRVGDLVLAQDPRSGELAFKPVIRTTIRAPEKLLRLRLAGETIRCTGGHPFWVAGEAWQKARKLKPGMLLHGVKTPVLVEQVTAEESPEQTYNLIVADFHSYFVGSSQVLSHDNTIREHSDAAVPGFVKR
jgi:hypothetical protein